MESLWNRERDVVGSIPNRARRCQLLGADRVSGSVDEVGQCRANLCCENILKLKVQLGSYNNYDLKVLVVRVATFTKVP